ncbi:hypothetical protein BD779DRAFT_1514814, partial [Infundibulicybe gibba]
MTSPVTYYIAAAVANSFTYGVLTILFVISMFLLGHRSTASRSSIYLKPVVLASILLFLIVTVHWAVTIYRLFKALAGTTQDAVAFVLDILSPSSVAVMSLVFLSGALGDFIIVCILRWVSNQILTFLIDLSCLAAFTGLIYQLITAGAQRNAGFFASWNRWIVAACVFTVCTNVYCSSFIMWRLWRTHRRSGGAGDNNIIRAAIIVIESAALYTDIYVCCNRWPPITGIAIMLINARVGLGRVRNLEPAPPISSFKFNRSDDTISPYNISFISITRT